MTTVIHHGPPGSYKTFSIVQRVLIEALVAGRVIVTNIRGFNDIEKIRTSLDVVIPDSAAIYYVEPSLEGFQQMARFFQWVPAGALIAMDEGQKVYPMRNKSFKHLDIPANQLLLDASGNLLLDVETKQPVFRPDTLENAFDQHRHFNWDIYISTPNISKIHSEIRGVVEWAYRHRNLSGVLPWKKDTWVEFRHDAESSGKSVSHYSGSPKQYKADKAVFDCYQSTATGFAQSSNENISVFRDSKLRFFFFVFCVAIGFVIYNGVAAYHRMSANINKTPVPVSPEISVPRDRVPDHAPDRLVPVAPVAPHNIVLKNPFKDATIYFVGSTGLTGGSASGLLFEVVFQDNRFLSFNYDDLRLLGFVMMQKRENFVVFDFAGETIYAFTKSSTAEASPDAMRGRALPESTELTLR